MMNGLFSFFPSLLFFNYFSVKKVKKTLKFNIRINGNTLSCDVNIVCRTAFLYSHKIKQKIAK